MKSISLFVDNGTYLTKVHPFTKLMYIAAAISIPPDHWKALDVWCVYRVSLCVLASGKILKKTFPLIAFSFTILLTIFLIHWIVQPEKRECAVSDRRAEIYRDGHTLRPPIGLNILNMLLSFAVFVLSTKPSEFVDELEKRGFSPRFGYIVTSVFQIIPQMMGTMNTIMDAQRSRGLETEGNLRTRAKAFLPLISPVVMSSLINTRERAIALEVRGSAQEKRKPGCQIGNVTRETRRSRFYWDSAFWQLLHGGSLYV